MVHGKHNRGVTLVEMLVVLGIIVVLAGIVVTAALRIDSQAKESELRNTFAVIGSALREYYEFKGQFPLQPERNSNNALAHVETLVKELRAVPAARLVLDKVSATLVKSEGGPGDLQSIRDPWGTPIDYTYVVPDDTYPELASAGPDRTFGTGDDIRNKGNLQTSSQ
jgi:prepilin-type N-terminal cleavage/methylation domain-containing protein